MHARRRGTGAAHGVRVRTRRSCADDECELAISSPTAMPPIRSKRPGSLRRHGVLRALDRSLRERRLARAAVGFEGDPWTLQRRHELDLTRELVGSAKAGTPRLGSLR